MVLSLQHATVFSQRGSRHAGGLGRALRALKWTGRGALSKVTQIRVSPVRQLSMRAHKTRVSERRRVAGVGFNWEAAPAGLIKMTARMNAGDGVPWRTAPPWKAKERAA